MNDVHYSSASNNWQTPDWLFQKLNEEFVFELDAAASNENAKCLRFYTQEIDALKQEWGKDANTIYVNPPYGRLVGIFCKKAREQTLKYPNLTVVMLIAARPDTRWWHENCAPGEVRFLKGRLKFINPSLPSFKTDGDFKMSPAPFPSAIIVLGQKARAGQTFYVSYKEPKL